MFNTFNYSNLYYAGRKTLCIVLKKVYQKSVNKMSVISYKQIIRLESGVRGGKQTPSGELSTDATEQGRRRAHIAAAVPVKISKEVVSSSMNGKPMSGQKLYNYL
jgi:hypothetical protein